MSGRRKVRPTEAELMILRVLWSRGPSSVRDVHESLGGEARTRYTTTLKQLQVMAEKQLVRRDESRRSHVYRAAVDEDETERAIVSSFVDRVFQGSVQKMVIHALESGRISDAEITEIKQLLKRREDRR
jgi:predicted transcriptional regulator